MVYYATETLLQTCMTAAGFDYPIEPYSEVPLPDRPYGIEDEEDARQWGYGLDPATFVDPKDLLVSQYYEALSLARQAEFNIALYGTRDGTVEVTTPIGTVALAQGCNGAAEATLKPDPARATELSYTLQHLRNEALGMSQDNPRVQLAFAGWSECMAARGYAIATPYEAGDTLSHEIDDLPSAAERDLAVADVQCKTEVSLVHRWSKVDAEYQDTLLEDHPGILEEYANLRTALLENAAEVTP
jgi:hypothetical protein